MRLGPLLTLRLPLYVQTLIGMCLGALVGYGFGKRAEPLGIIGKTIIEIIKIGATPLLFVAIFDALIRLEVKGRGFFWMIVVNLINGSCAIAIALIISNTLEPGRLMAFKKFEALNALDALNLSQGLDALLRKSPEEIFFRHSMPAAIFLGFILGLVGIGIERSSPKNVPLFDKVRELSQKFFHLCLKILGWIIHLVPIAVFGSVARAVGKSGFDQWKGLGAYFIVCIVGMSLHILLVYQTWIFALARVGFRKFWQAARDPIVYAFGANSSLATLPLTLKGLEQLQVSKASSRLAACLGTNLNNDGILLYEVVGVLFMAQAYGMQWPLMQQMGIAILCVAAMLGVGGIPESGIISMSLVLGTVGLPTENVPLLLTVDWFIARCRSLTNVLGDMAGAISIDYLMYGSRKSSV